MDQEVKNIIVDFIKSFTRLIVQSNLYSEQHPQVKEASNQLYSSIHKLFEKLSVESVVLTLKEDKLLLNGQQILSADRIPNSMLNLFKTARIDSIKISNNVRIDELIKFVKIISSKLSPEEFLKQNNIDNIQIEKDVYVKASGENPSELGGGANISREIEEKDFIESLKVMVSKLTDDPEEQKKIITNLLDKFKKEVENAINKAVNDLKKEKTKIENDYIRTESVISNIASGVLTVDKNGNIIMADPNAQNITGAELKQIAGKKIFDIVNIEEQIINIAEEIKSESDKKIEPKVNLKGKDELINTIKKSTAVIKNEEGKIVGTLSIPQDIAKLKEVEQLKNDFISTITHELRSPLTSIKMALDLLNRENLSANTKAMLNAAVRNAERLNSIINDILDFSKLQSGKMVFNFDRENPNEIAQNAVDSMKAWANSKGLKLILNKLPDEHYIYVDRKRTEQILINLISNAIKFTPEGGTITVDVKREDDRIVFSVKDTGCGIKKEDQEKIFEKFVQAISGEKVGGTGLGLAITKAMVIMQKGKISLESEVGKGSTFYVSFPVYKQQTQTTQEISLQESMEDKRPWWKKLLGIK